jgi:TRAP transporter TAXI family solute receptor
MKKRVIYFVSSLFFLVIGLFSFIPAASAQQPMNRLSMGTGGTGGVFYIMGAGIANILSKYMPNTEVTVEVTGGSVDNCKLLKANKADLALSGADICMDAFQGVDKFGKGNPEDKIPLRALGAIYTNHMHFITHKDSPIKTIGDLRGKRVSTGSPGSGTEVKTTKILEAFGIHVDKDIKRERLGANESVNAFKDRKLDVIGWDGGIPTGAILDLAATPGLSIKMIPCAEAVTYLEKKYPGAYYPTVIPKGTYPGIDYDVASVGHTNLFVTLDKMDAKLAYDITKTLYNHIKPDLIAVHKEAAKITLKTITTGSPIPWHPGAVKFYAEQGIQLK